MRCVGGSCLSVCGLQDHAIVTPQPCCFHMWGLQRLYVPIPDVGEVTIQTERKRAVWSSHLFIIHYWAWSRSLRGGVPGWRRVSSRRWFVWVSERNELFEHFQGNDVRQKLRDRLGDLCELWLRLGQPLEAFSPGQPSVWRPQGSTASKCCRSHGWRHRLMLLSTFSMLQWLLSLKSVQVLFFL